MSSVSNLITAYSFTAGSSYELWGACERWLWGGCSLAHAQRKAKEEAGNSKVQRCGGRMEGRDSRCALEKANRLFTEVSVALGNRGGDAIVQRLR